ncbi:BREX-1 system adenine-specific DNA-methyltransferase PglX [Gimesia chilikensis]|uniref:site-specific DNA-methyltransferase (adenine-specific) n=1 Tax=Gimesia chilikensis TaxID=2605989 RepID=A0A517PYA5_9PLAN|nr:BREX-1 system adenine-specific DNA-methyltransferase PglX [Gimesia chilikensis]QDT24367.1 hypothetical protein HG66A1_61990 [Gimesia chilikensis]
MDQEIRNKLRNVVTQCRKLLEDSISQELEGKYTIFTKDEKVIADSNAEMNNLTTDEDRAARKDILDHFAHIKARGFKPKEALDQLVREIAFTHLNRLCAYKMMEARDVYVGGQKFREAVSRGVNSNGVKFYLADHEEDERLYNTGHQDVAYRHFLDWLGGALSDEIGVLFNPNDPANRLYPRQKTLDEVLDLLNGGGIKAEETELREQWPLIWSQDETIGWVYQYFTPKELRDKARKESQAPRNSYELAFRNQFFTPRYVVEFLTDNTLGRIWYEMRKGETRLKDQCRYMVRRPTDNFLKEDEQPPKDAAEGQDDLSQEELLKLPVPILHRQKKDPRELKILDPACGSGHFLLYCFDLLLTIYEEAYADPDLGPALQKDYPKLEDLERDVPRLILAHNLHGIDIDLRASQIAALALWLRCQRAYQDMGLKKDRPTITRSNFVCAEPMPGEEQMLKEFVGQLEPKVLGQVVEVVFDKMKLAGEAGSLLKIEEEIRDAIREAKRQYEIGGISIQRTLFDKPSEPVVKVFSVKEITDSQFFEQAEEKVIEALRSYAEKAQNGQRLQRRLFTEDAVRGFAFVDLCQNRYDVVLMNPPFGLAPERAFAYLKKAFPLSYTELLATFVERSLHLCTGIGGAITSRSFMVATRLRNWRHDILIDRIVTIADLGAAVMDAALVESAAYTFVADPLPRHPLVAFDVRRQAGREEQLSKAIRIDNGGESVAFRLLPSVFKRFPNYKILYSLPSKVADLLVLPSKFEPTVGTARQGMTTWDDFRFIRLRWEVAPDMIGPNNRWEHLAKGGGYQRYYGNIHLVVGWDSDGKEMREANIRVNGTDAQARQASDYWRRPGATYSLRSGRGFSARVLPSGCLFTSQGPVIFSESKVSNIAILGWVNSKLITSLIELQSNAGKFMSGIIKTLPWKGIECDDLPRLEAATNDLIQNLRSLDAINETSAVYCGLPNCTSLTALIRNVRGQFLTLQQRVTAIDADWDRTVNAAYGMTQQDVRRLREINVFDDDDDSSDGQRDDEGTPSLSDSTIAGMLLSHSVGIVFGRWGLKSYSELANELASKSPYSVLPSYPPQAIQDTPGSLQSQAGGLPQDSQTLAILVDDPDHADDIVRRIRDVCDVISEGRGDAVETEACDILGVKKIRDYLRKPGKNGFWDDHVTRYSQSRRSAPIYWLLQSLKKNYAIWLYYHQLDKDLLFKALVNYVEPKIRLETSRLEALRSQSAVAGDSGKEAKRIAKEAEKQEDFLSELRDFEDKLRRAANLHLEPDLNDGVVLNIAPLHELVPWKVAKKYWNELLAGKYEWSSIGKQLHQKGLVK